MMLDLLRMIDASIDPSDVLHADVRDRIRRHIALEERAQHLRAEARRLMDAGDIEGAQSCVDQGAEVLNELSVLTQRAQHVASCLRPSTATCQ